MQHDMGHKNYRRVGFKNPCNTLSHVHATGMGPSDKSSRWNTFKPRVSEAQGRKVDVATTVSKLFGAEIVYVVHT